MWTGIIKETEGIADNSVAAVCSAKIAETSKKNVLKGLKRPIILSVEYLNSWHESEIRPMFIETDTLKITFLWYCIVGRAARKQEKAQQQQLYSLLPDQRGGLAAAAAAWPRLRQTKKSNKRELLVNGIPAFLPPSLSLSLLSAIFQFPCLEDTGAAGICTCVTNCSLLYCNFPLEYYISIVWFFPVPFIQKLYWQLLVGLNIKIKKYI